LHKSLRGSDPDAALYWMGRMLDAGEPPLYVARRMVRFASEDIGNADPHALLVSMAAVGAFQLLGLPEGELALAQAAVYLATAPKSNALYTAYGRIKETIRKTGYLPVPLHIRNAPTKLMRELDYGRGYQYAHNFDHAYVAQEYMPEGLNKQHYYLPTDRGHEKIIKERMAYWEKMRSAKKDDLKKEKPEGHTGPPAQGGVKD
jgi:putative ATPase